MRQKRTPEEVEALMVPRIVTALYPILIPVEQQDVRIQAESYARITEVARATWRAFVSPSNGDGKGAT
jgi:hypothetical protein